MSLNPSTRKPSDPTVPPFPPIEPPGVRDPFPDPRQLGDEDVAGFSLSMTPGLVLLAYRRGIFPWPVAQGAVAWVSPNPRCVLPLDRPPAWPRSLRKTVRRGRFRVTFDRAFDEVVRACASGRKEGTWITRDIRTNYGKLHQLGWTHSVEVWSPEETLVGGLYGVALGAIFAGESMFHRERDASKVAFVALVEHLRERGFQLLDAQVPTPHLASLGCIAIPRDEFLDRLAALQSPPRAFLAREPGR